jgi:hypothetical protein
MARLGVFFRFFLLVGALGTCMATCMARWAIFFVRALLVFVRALLVFGAVSFAAAVEVFNYTMPSLPSRPTHSRAHKWISTFL